MSVFSEPLMELADFSEALDDAKKGKFPIQFLGCVDSQKPQLIHAFSEKYAGETSLFQVIVTYNELRARELYEDYCLYRRNVYFYPAKDVIFFSADVHGNAIVKSRLEVIKAILEQKPATIITTIDAGLDRLLPLEVMKAQVLRLCTGDLVDFGEMQKLLVTNGYERCAQVEATGQFSVRGGILDIFPLTEECPYRIELFDDEIDTIRMFDAESQRTIDRVSELVIYPATEYIMTEECRKKGFERLESEKRKQIEYFKKKDELEACRRIRQVVDDWKESFEIYAGSVGIESYISYFYDETVSFFDYFDSKNTLFFLDEPMRLEERAEAVQMEFSDSMERRMAGGYLLPGQISSVYSQKEILARFTKKNLCSIFLSMLDNKCGILAAKQRFSISVQSINSYQRDFARLVKDLKEWKQTGYRVILLSPTRQGAKRLEKNLRQEDVFAYYSENHDRPLEAGEIMVTCGSIHKGFLYSMIKFVVIAESDIFGKEARKKRKPVKKYEGDRIQSFTELNVGDYVVHENHGIGIYQGIEKVEVNKTVKDYIKIAYDKGGVLYVPTTGLETLQKYATAGSKTPKLNRLDSPEWEKTKKKVKGAVAEVAKELVELYAKRQEKKGYAFSADDDQQMEFEELFPFEETQDQLTAIADTKRDMQSSKIMDRLICGDVGFGKTEIAIRAAFKAVLDGKQVAFLVPTTILAQQHYNTLVQRMKDYPVNIEMLSRFRTSKQQKETIEKLKKGLVDIVVGTHRLLSKDVTFKQLGLLVVDEEQRFGVTHKEKIKLMKENVDVLTLTATPIPRTLHMSLVGIRDMSVLEEAPVDRRPIQTFVMEHNDEIIRDAISRELARGGQVYYVFNRVAGIENVAFVIEQLVPEANVAYAHGQMSERELEEIMYHFINGEIDVLVSTTIIETGLDIANVNTMIIDDADKLGLSQLYQLRGRVGRSSRTSFAFLMYRRDKILREVAEKRLSAIKEFTDLGSGFKIAMRDLEIRGAGAVLGQKQHGHMAAVGYDMYCRMLNDAVKRMKGEKPQEEFTTTMKIDMDAYIPSTYIKSEFQKLDIYKRIAEIGSPEERYDLAEEMIDRFGEFPKQVDILLEIAVLKAKANKAYITQVSLKNRQAELLFDPKAPLHFEKTKEFLEQTKENIKLDTKGLPKFCIGFDAKSTGMEQLQRLGEIVDCISNLIDEEK